MKNKGMEGLRPGLTGTVELVVTAQHTAAQMGSGPLPVLATPALVALMEAAAQRAVESALPAGWQSVGIHIDVRHDKLTPIGMKVVVTAELTALEGRTLHFRLTARDDREPIGTGVHQRMVSAAPAFERLLRQKETGIS